MPRKTKEPIPEPVIVKEILTITIMGEKSIYELEQISATDRKKISITDSDLQEHKSRNDLRWMDVELTLDIMRGKLKKQK